MFIKKATANFSFPRERFESGFKILKSKGVLAIRNGSNHKIVYATDYFKNNLVNERILDRLPNGAKRRVSDGIIVNGEILTLSASMDLKETKNEIYGGSTIGWEKLLISMYVLCKPYGNGIALKNEISEIFSKCFSLNISSSKYYNKLTENLIIKDFKDIVVTNNLLLNDYIFNRIKNFKDKLINNKDTDISTDLKNIDERYFNPIIYSASEEERESVERDVVAARNELLNIFSTLENSSFQSPLIFTNIISENFESDISVILSLMEEREFSFDEIYNRYKELLDDKINIFKERFISNNEEVSDAEAESMLRLVFKNELDKILSEKRIIKKDNDDKYSIIIENDSVNKKLAKLYNMVPSYVRTDIFKLAKKYNGI